MTNPKLRDLQIKDPDIGPVFSWKQQGPRPSGSIVSQSAPATRHYWILWESLKIKHGLLFREFLKKNGSGSYLQLILPKVLREKVLYQMHNGQMAGHLGDKKTREKVLQLFYWFGLRIDVSNWVRKCDICASIKSPTKGPKAPLGVMTVGAPLDRLGTDFVGPLPLTPRGNRHILVVTDYFTKWVEIFAVPDQSSVTTAEVILNEVIARYGVPLEIISDQGRNYESLIFSELCRLLEIRKTRTSPGNPKCNGLTERFNKTLLRMIKAYLKGEDCNWDKNLGCLAAAYRASRHESTNMTPNMLMLGRQVRLPSELLFGSGTNHVGEEITSYGDYVDKLKERMQKAHEITRKHLNQVAERQQRDHDFKINLNRYKQGSLVWYRSGKSQLHITPKLRCAYEGPYLVLKQVNDLDYIIQFNSKGSRQIVHHDRLKPYEGDLTLPWSKRALKRYRNE